jgi:hypothetical protein
MRFIDHSLLVATDIRGTTYSDSNPLEHVLGFSIQVTYTGNITQMNATLSLQTSNDNSAWEDMADSETEITGLSGCTMYNVDSVYSKYIRLKIVPGAGTVSTLVATLYAKEY